MNAQNKLDLSFLKNESLSRFNTDPINKYKITFIK